MKKIAIQPMNARAFAPYGDLIEAGDGESFLINQGKCRRFHDLTPVDITGEGGKAGISLFRGTPYPLPLTLDLMERHPLGSQAFVPLGGKPFLVVAAPDEGGRPGLPLAFLTEPCQGINLKRNVWHGVLTPLEAPADFVVIDRVGTGNNLEEHTFSTPYTVDF